MNITLVSDKIYYPYCLVRGKEFPYDLMLVKITLFIDLLSLKINLMDHLVVLIITGLISLWCRLPSFIGW